MIFNFPFIFFSGSRRKVTNVVCTPSLKETSAGVHWRHTVNKRTRRLVRDRHERYADLCLCDIRLEHIFMIDYQRDTASGKQYWATFLNVWYFCNFCCLYTLDRADCCIRCHVAIHFRPYTWHVLGSSTELQCALLSRGVLRALTLRISDEIISDVTIEHKSRAFSFVCELFTERLACIVVEKSAPAIICEPVLNSSAFFFFYYVVTCAPW